MLEFGLGTCIGITTNKINIKKTFIFLYFLLFTAIVSIVCREYILKIESVYNYWSGVVTSFSRWDRRLQNKCSWKVVKGLK